MLSNFWRTIFQQFLNYLPRLYHIHIYQSTLLQYKHNLYSSPSSFQLIGISISLATALATVDGSDAKVRAKATTVKPATTTKAAEGNKDKATTKTLAKPSTAETAARSAKVLKSPSAGNAATASDKRGKRTLYDFENAGYLYPEIASRRAGYENDGQAYYSQSTQSGYYNGQNAIGE